MPLDKEQKITDDTRIRAAVPTLKYLLDNGAKVLLTSHLVRFVLLLVTYRQQRHQDSKIAHQTLPRGDWRSDW